MLMGFENEVAGLRVSRFACWDPASLVRFVNWQLDSDSSMPNCTITLSPLVKEYTSIYKGSLM